ncbi:hypothetical protein M1403_02925 [Patescibacteria group bacterium]|nr:hypothetical protein [Patescibacteria group bacterium]
MDSANTTPAQSGPTNPAAPVAPSPAPTPITPPSANPVGQTVSVNPPPVAAEASSDKWNFLAIAGIILVVVLVGAGAFLIMSNPQMLGSLTGNKAQTTTPAANPPLVPKTPTQTPPTAPQPPASPQPIDEIPLTIATPVNNVTVTTATIKVTGTTSARADVSVNEIDTKADATGKFSATLTLSEGDNPIVIDAVDENGQTSERELTVTYQPAGS